ncbi:unnamed protein product [Calypogeia fissa]
MAGWGDAVEIGGRSYLYRRVLEVAVLIYIATCTSVPTSYAQNGFLSLDCGGTQANYNDSHSLQWVSDDGYISTGNSSKQSDYPSDLPALGSFRYFPGDRSKYCYALPTPNLTYLVRASFYMDRSELTARTPFEFIFSVDATDWFTVTSGDGTSQSLLVVQEGIFTPPNGVTKFCLRPVSGVPFISSLELRLMDQTFDYYTTMYAYTGSGSQYLALGIRYNCGAKNISDVRYPQDPFDRIWKTPDASFDAKFASIHSTKPTPNTTIDENFVPREVMQDAWLIPDDGSFATLSISPIFTTGPQAYVTLSEYAFALLYFEDLNKTASGINQVDIHLEGSDYYLDYYWNTTSQPTLFENTYTFLTRNGFNILLQWDNASTSPVGDLASVNAVEVYGQLTYNFSITNTDDADFISALQTGFSLTDWQGGPCVPVPYNELSCQLSGATYGLSQSPVQRTIFLTQFNVNSLEISDIKNSNFSGIVGNSTILPNFRLHGLDTMSITNSGVDDQTCLFLINYTSTVLTTLNLSNNVIGTFPRVRDWAGTDRSGLQNLTTLDLSHNDLTGALSSFDGVPFSSALQNLNLSSNSMISFPQKWGNNTVNKLVTLDLSHNQFSGNMSSLDEWIQMNSGSLQELDVSHNQLYGTFSNDLYFKKLKKLTYANFDQNSIEGTLNLSTWYAALQGAAAQLASMNLTLAPVTQQLYSFMNNNISDIVPSARDFDSTIHNLFIQYPSFGVLLNGNPYCNDIKSPVQGYLCRSSISITFKDDHKKNTMEILIISICGGVVGLLFFSITSAILWKLWKQVYALRAIQQALADRKVQPPFYQYSDLKTATRDFHRTHKLGHGGFGVVYKAVYPDETLAVKKLFNSKKAQVIDEFLNEVVLITGIKHRNLVQLKGCCVKDKNRILVYEFADNGNLAEALWGSQVVGRLNWRQRINICVGVARGLSYLHEELQPSVIHRDIKPQNILLDKDFNPKIADFGLARHFSDEINQAHYTQIAGTIGYFAPEYAMQGQVSDKTDVYSYGILILEVVSRRKCIDLARPAEEKFLKDWVFSMRRKSLLFDVLQPELRGDCNEEEVIRAINIALLCVQHNPERRPTMSQVVTMFLGNMNVEIFSDEFDNIRSNFTKLIATAGHEIEQSSLHIIEEESPSSPLLDVHSSSSHSVSSSRSDAKHLLELSAVYGR